MHAVLGLLEHDGLRAVKDLIGHFHGVAVKLFAHLPADGGLVVVVGGQAVHEHGGALGLRHQLGVDLIGGQGVDALLPDLDRLTHADPDVGVDDIRTGHGVGVLAQRDAAAADAGELFALFHQRGVRPVGFGGAGHKMQAHLGAADHQAVAHVVAGVAHVGEFQPLQLAEMLTQR